MPIKINQFPFSENSENGLVAPEEDAALYNFILRANTMIMQPEVSSLGGNQIIISDGMGVIYGRQFIITSEKITVPLPSENIKAGRLLVHIDISNPEHPIGFVVQTDESLPDLQQENFLKGGSIFQIEIATFKVDETHVFDIQNKSFIASNLMYKEEFVEGKKILRNSDLNNIITPGMYRCPHNGDVQTLKNTPTANAFSLFVEVAAGPVQTLVEFLPENFKCYRRHYYDTRWGDWQRIYTTSDPPQNVENATYWNNMQYLPGTYNPLQYVMSSNNQTDWHPVQSSGFMYRSGGFFNGSVGQDFGVSNANAARFQNLHVGGLNANLNFIYFTL